MLLRFGSCSDSELYPILAVCEYLELRGWGTGMLFQHADDSPLTKHQFWAVTFHALMRISLAGPVFGTHSFYIGTTSTAAAMGYLACHIQSVEK